MRNIRKGMSSIVQIMFIISLTLISLTLMWSYVKDLSSSLDEKLSPVVDCISQKSKVLSACINEENIEVKVEVALNEMVEDIRFTSSQESFICGKEVCDSCNLEGTFGKKTIYISHNKEAILEPSSFSVSINGCPVEQVEIKNCNS